MEETKEGIVIVELAEITEENFKTGVMWMSYEDEDTNEEDKEKSSIKETDEEIIAEVIEESFEPGDEETFAFSLRKRNNYPLMKMKDYLLMIEGRQTHRHYKRR